MQVPLRRLGERRRSAAGFRTCNLNGFSAIRRGIMSIRSRIYLFQSIILASVILMGAIVYVTLLWTNEYLQRVQQVDERLETVTLLQVSASQYAERIPELLLPAANFSAFESARSELERNVDRVEKRIRGHVDDGTRPKLNLDELHRLERLRAIRREIDGFVLQLIALRDQGRHDEAVAMFHREIRTRLDGGFHNVILAAVLDEKDEVGWAEDRAASLWRNLAVAAIVAGFLAGMACLVVGGALVRTLLRPIRLLTDGTEAMSRGDLDHRIQYEGSDELGALAKRFNEMAARHQQQRALLLQTTESLEAQVEARTRELGAANQRLVDLDRMRAQFLADISHELRTPLTALRGEAEVTLRHAPGEEAYRATLQKIVSQTSEMNRLVEDLLFLARTEADTIRFEWRRLVLQDVIADATCEAETLARARDIQIEVDYPPDPIWVQADPQRLKQALMILLDNAIKYSSPGGSVILRADLEGMNALVSVRDEGVGIPAEDLPKVFERYYRGRMSGTSGQGGTGLGLAIAKWLVEKHGGDITVTSEENRFTEVRILMPMLEVRSFAQDSAR